MTSKTFTAGTVIDSAWLNDVNTQTYGGVGSSLGTPFTQSGTGAVQRALQLKALELKTPYDYGCVGDGLVDDTVNFQKFVNAVTAGDIPAGNFKIGKITIPATCKTLRGRGAASVLTAFGTFTAFTPWLFFNGQTDIDVGDFTLNINSTTYATNHAMQFGACNRGTVNNIHMLEGGYISVYASACAGIVFDNILIDNFAVSQFLADGTPSGLTVSRIRSSVAGTGHGISITGGSFHTVSDCLVSGAGASFFGISLYQLNDCKVINNVVQATKREGIQLADGSRNQILDNLVHCQAGHEDFGISIFADGAAIQHNKISGNTIISSGGPGIGISASYTPVARICQLNSVTDNVIINPCQFTVIAPAAIEMLGGATCTGNIIQGNSCFDSTNKMVYGVYEWNSGGNPDNNKFIYNPCFGGAGFLLEGYVVGTNSEVYDLIWNTSTPTPTAFSGSIAGSTAIVKYKRKGKSADLSVKVTISTTNTGTGYLIVPMPLSIANGVITGSEGSTGKMLQGTSGGVGILRLYDYAHAYPSTAVSVTHQASGTVEI